MLGMPAYIAFQEEDFVIDTYSMSLLEDIEYDKILDFLRETAEVFIKEEAGIAPVLVEALSTRLEFRIRFLEAVELADSRTEASRLKSIWLELVQLCHKLNQSTSLGQFGKACPNAFSVKIQRQLASTVPPRPIVEVSQEAAYDHLVHLCQDASDMLDVLNYYDSHSMLVSIYHPRINYNTNSNQTFVMLFQARKPQPAVYIRTLLQYYLFGDVIVLGKMSVRQILDDDFSSTVLPASELLDRANDEIEVITDPRHQMAAQMELFRQRAAQSYFDILRTLCQNRCRIRRTLCHSIREWDNLQYDAEELDQRLREFTMEQPVIDLSISVSTTERFHSSASKGGLHKLLPPKILRRLNCEGALQSTIDTDAASYYTYA